MKHELYEDGFINKEQQVRALFKQGMSKTVIAEKTKVSVTEVESILSRNNMENNLNE